MFDANKIKVEALVDIEGRKKGEQFMMKKVLFENYFQDKVKIVSEKKQVKNKKNKAIKNPETK